MRDGGLASGNVGDAVVPTLSVCGVLPTAEQLRGMVSSSSQIYESGATANPGKFSCPEKVTSTLAGLTKAQQSELDMARRRAQKAAEGKRANAELAAHRLKVTREPGRAEVATQPTPHTELKNAGVTDGKEQKRLKRLLRNRVSAQQARERKKTYVTDLEAKANRYEQHVAQLEQRLKTKERENLMLRSIIRNMQGSPEKADTGCACT